MDANTSSRGSAAPVSLSHSDSAPRINSGPSERTNAMPRKGKQAKPAPSRSPAAANKYGRWRRSVQELLIARWQNSDDVEAVAGTVVGMFDAGATDAEVAAFLHSQESGETAESLTDEARMALVRELHGSAGSPSSVQSSDEES
jgi:hypothetical protein